MISATSLAYPGGKTLAGWWQQLRGYQPHALWVGYSFLHRVEALVEVRQIKPLDHLSRLLLQALADSPATVPTCVIPLPPALIGPFFKDLAHEGLTAATTAGAWSLTEQGRSALAEGGYQRTVHERRAFHFVERVDGTGRRLAPPAYLTLNVGAHTPWRVDEAHGFDVAWLRDCFVQERAWKEAVAFPIEARCLLEPAWENNGPTWKRVIVDRPEQVLMVWLKTTGRAEEALGFIVQPEGWLLSAASPSLRLPWETAVTSLHDLTAPPAEAWRLAWRNWCQARHLPADEINQCRLKLEGHRLRIAGPARLWQRLRAARNEALKGDFWLLAGENHVKAAAQVEPSESENAEPRRGGR